MLRFFYTYSFPPLLSVCVCAGVGCGCRGLRPVWCGLIPVAALWLLLQEEAPLYLSLGLPEVGARLLLASALCLGAGLGVLAVWVRNHSRKPQVEEPQVQEKNFSLVHNQRVMAGNSPRTTQTRPRGGAAEHAVPVVQALTDCLVLSLLHEPQHTSATFSVLPLISRLQALSKALQKADIPWAPLSQENHRKEENNMDVVTDRIKDINMYIEERAEALQCLQRLQAEFEGSVREAEAQLQEHWRRLEELHVRVTLSPTHAHSLLPDSSLVLKDTQCLVSDLEQSKSSVHQCQTYLAANSKILKELEHSWLELSRTLNSELLYSSWTADLLQANTDKFNDVLQSLTSLEQQTSTFETHLQGLEKAVALDSEQAGSSTTVAHSSQHPNGSLQDLIVETQSPVIEDKSSKHSLKLKSGILCGLRKKRK
ncbi:hypothetical protein ACEWY4_007852 [Coilia grayii]|uniref:Uncharacterized protein n=1 Tax=Coilia grayii TaxID=363190 RepID=A0ABD1K9D4_9TELE